MKYRPAAFHQPEAATTVTFGDAHITIPPGWTHIERNKLLLMLPPDITEKKNLNIILLPGQDTPGVDFPQAVDAILKKSLAANEHLVQYSELPVRKGSGYEFLTRAMVVADDAGNNSVRVCFATNLGHRLEMLIVSADSKETLKHYEPEISLVLNSYSFADAPVQADTKQGDSSATRVTSATSAGVQSQEPGTGANAKGESKTSGSKTATAGNRVQVAEGESLLVCIDPARLDFAMDAAKMGHNYDAGRALSYDYVFRVTGPASLEVTQYDTKSRWPKAFVTVVDGDSAGKAGWAIISELKRVQQPPK
ncbi:MAG TPA: hypothetical protein VJA94_16820 [Candidatus Angelobacter sp.]